MATPYRIQLVFFGETAPPVSEAKALVTRFEGAQGAWLATYDEHSARADQWRRDPQNLDPQGRIAIDLDTPPTSTSLELIHQQTGAAVYLSRVYWPLPLDLEAGTSHAGTLQWSGFQKLAELDAQELGQRWLQEHTEVAISCQNTESYAQHEILAHFGPALDGIAEETFPIEAADSAAVFFGAEEQPADLKNHVATLLDSSRRFIDFDTLSVAHFTEQRLH